ncbi:MAG: hypothetical protein ABSE16_14655 [Verrucomicrobiota bacterium]
MNKGAMATQRLREAPSQPWSPFVALGIFLISAAITAALLAAFSFGGQMLCHYMATHGH